MNSHIRKAVFPLGGLGTRFLPATKAMPKEMLPILDKPLIQYAFEEAKAAGIEEFIFVTGRGKSAVEDHFDISYELSQTLEKGARQEELEKIQSLLVEPGRIIYTRQQRPLGLGHAVWCARHTIGHEPFAVILADDFILGHNCLEEMIAAHKNLGGNMMAVMTVPHEETSKYGILDVDHQKDQAIIAKGLVEKPTPDKAPSTIAIVGRYIIDPGIFSILEKTLTQPHGEIQLTDALNHMIPHTPTHGWLFKGSRYDCGSKVGFLKATLACALKDKDLEPVVRAMAQI